MAGTAQKRGLFITFEGGEGSGKSSQVKRLLKELEKIGEKAIATREPGGSPGAEAIRHVLLSGAAEVLGTDMEAILFAAARADHVTTIIEPALSAGTHVLCDRFIDSTRVYQGATGAVDADFLAGLEAVACGDVRPDLTIVLDIDPAEGMKRAQSRREGQEAPDRFEKESLALQQERREAYLRIAEKEPERCVVINAKGSPATVFGRIKSALRERLGLFDEQPKKPAKRRSPGTGKRQTKTKRPPAKTGGSAGAKRTGRR